MGSISPTAFFESRFAMLLLAYYGIEGITSSCCLLVNFGLVLLVKLNSANNDLWGSW